MVKLINTVTPTTYMINGFRHADMVTSKLPIVHASTFCVLVGCPVFLGCSDGPNEVIARPSSLSAEVIDNGTE
ncbi:hypothetical protein SARC_17917 [Sphaeroforma arctica JP610]|uniref:Uncharacterized protein n=1 Tax=Sphaeroforma arctica JP610 TaxID=667725 RepID=A0A0L0EYP8_9EUKA|nr:hypothetical protein SARC_17917 [Sphaeroforma arctica JP610]KNC69572.1 hypothetical protein SARC_17917 [Sphaeroforma arctica JP610]|eukprot:XP_014143474.1 hypothetical protein SARC_17917 [Sphaeroforma arctica JP610]